jgi:hypothetical protein
MQSSTQDMTFPLEQVCIQCMDPKCQSSITGATRNDSEGTGATRNDSEGTGATRNDSEGTGATRNDSEGTGATRNDSEGTGATRNDSEGTCKYFFGCEKKCEGGFCVSQLIELIESSISKKEDLKCYCGDIFNLDLLEEFLKSLPKSDSMEKTLKNIQVLREPQTKKQWDPEALKIFNQTLKKFYYPSPNISERSLQFTSDTCFIPTMRACPKCLLLLNHSCGCKIMTCVNCNHCFCFGCLLDLDSPKPEHNYDLCLSAPAQEFK